MRRVAHSERIRRPRLVIRALIFWLACLDAIQYLPIVPSPLG
jgi:hypothetical protein